MLFGVSVFVIVPAFNEASRLPRVIETMPPEVDHVIVVDDASDDGTFDIARASADPRVIALRHDANRGVGGAIVTGYRRALEMPGGPRDAFVVMAGDGQMDPGDLPALALPIADGEAGYVKGNRFAHPDIDAMPLTRRLGGLFFSVLTALAIGLPVHDSQCGYTALARSACAQLDLGALWPRFGYPNDLLAMLARARIRIAERPIRALYPHTRNKLAAWHVPIIALVTLRAWARRWVAWSRTTYYLGASFFRRSSNARWLSPSPERAAAWWWLWWPARWLRSSRRLASRWLRRPAASRWVRSAARLHSASRPRDDAARRALRRRPDDGHAPLGQIEDDRRPAPDFPR